VRHSTRWYEPLLRPNSDTAMRGFVARAHARPDSGTAFLNHRQPPNFLPSNIYCSIDFQRNALDHSAKLKQTGAPAVLTIHRQTEVAVRSGAKATRTSKLLEALACERGIPLK